MSGFKYGTCTVPDGTRGPWRIETFKLSEHDVFFGNFRAIRDGNPELYCKPGTYRRLVHEKRGVVMSNTRMEINTSMECYLDARGRVLLNGLGLGMTLEGVLSHDYITAVKVIEIDPDIIALVGPHFANDKRVEIVCADAYDYKPTKDDVFDYAWHDIWDSISSDNLPLMAKLTRKWRRPRVQRQGVWSRDMALRQRRREKQSPWGWR
jgi:hypothetical protein